jgi:dolichol-phosphate mannosyltransferase
MKRPENPVFELLIPCYNESAVIPLLLDALTSFEAKCPYDVRITFIDDGSRDNTFELLKAACEKHKNWRVLRFSRNFGHQAAVSAGLAHANGDVIGVIDADLQDPPEVLLEMLAKWAEGYDVVYGVRRNRKENVLLRSAYSLFYMMLKKMANVDIPLDAGDFSVIDRRVAREINNMPEHNRFIRGLRGWIGFKQYGLAYERRARAAGEPKYTLRKLFKLAFDGLITFSSVPLKLGVWIGGMSAFAGSLYLVYALVQKLVFHSSPQGWASLVAIVVFFGGVQLLVLGIIGSYIGRIFDEVKNRPHYIVAEIAGGENLSHSGTK